MFAITFELNNQSVQIETDLTPEGPDCKKSDSTDGGFESES